MRVTLKLVCGGGGGGGAGKRVVSVRSQAVAFPFGEPDTEPCNGEVTTGRNGRSGRPRGRAGPRQPATLMPPPVGKKERITPAGIDPTTGSNQQGRSRRAAAAHRDVVGLVAGGACGVEGGTGRASSSAAAGTESKEGTTPMGGGRAQAGSLRRGLLQLHKAAGHGCRWCANSSGQQGEPERGGALPAMSAAASAPPLGPPAAQTRPPVIPMPPLPPHRWAHSG
jgi:hypothetical protein